MLSCVLTAALRGQSAEGQEALNAFADFWNNTGASCIEPVGGWAGEITEALAELAAQQRSEVLVCNLQLDTQDRNVAPVGNEELVEDDSFDDYVSLEVQETCADTTPDDPAPVFSESKEEQQRCDVLELSQGLSLVENIVEVQKDLFNDSLGQTPRPQSEIKQESEKEAVPPFATPLISFATPRHMKTKTPIPTRPERSSVGSGISRSGGLQCPSSPLSEASIRKRKRSRRQRITSSGSQSKRSEKENAAPLTASSVNYPLQTYTGSPVKVLGKRNALEESPRPVKKRKISEGDSDILENVPISPFALYNTAEDACDKEDERLVEERLVVVDCNDVVSHPVVEVKHSPRLTETPDLASSPPTQRQKRKGVFLDSVMVPTLMEIMRGQKAVYKSFDEAMRIVIEPIPSEIYCLADEIVQDTDQRFQMCLMQRDQESVERLRLRKGFKSNVKSKG